MIERGLISTPLGPMLAAAENGSLIGLWFFDQNHFPKESKNWSEAPELRLFQQLQAQMDAYFDGHLADFVLPLAPRGTPFQREVWALLLKIAPGETTTYGRLARNLAADRGIPSMSAQAVGGAVGRNPLSILIPCHRVVGADGSLTGYDGGIHRKEILLALESRGKKTGRG